VPLALADHRDHIGQTRPAAHPGFGFQSFGQRKQFAGQRFIARELDRARRRIAISELDASRQADTLSHRRERKAAIGIPHGMAERGIALDTIMHVIAALYPQRDLIAEWSKDIVGPRQGTTAELWLPVAKKTEKAAEAETPAQVPAKEHRRLIVLVVDDDPLVLTNMAAMLDDIGHRVFEAGSAREAHHPSARKWHPACDHRPSHAANDRIATD